MPVSLSCPQPEEVDNFQSLMRLLEVPPAVWQSEAWSSSKSPVTSEHPIDRPDLYDIRPDLRDHRNHHDHLDHRDHLREGKHHSPATNGDEDLGGDLNIDVVGKHRTDHVPGAAQSLA